MNSNPAAEATVPARTWRPAMPGLVIAIALAMAATAAIAQSPARPPAAPKVGLDSLRDDAVLAEMGTRQLDKLQDYSFDSLNIKPELRRTLRGVAALKDLLDDQKLAAMPAPERRDLIAKAAAGAPAVLPTMKDFDRLIKLASVLGAEAVQSDVNRLEYFGDDDRTRAKMRAAAEAVVLTFERAIAVAEETCSRLIAKEDPTRPLPQTVLTQWEQWDQKRSIAQYNKAMAEYWAILAMEKADTKRTQRIDGVIRTLSEWDNPESTVQASVRNRIGKLLWARGDYPAAKEKLDSVRDNPGGQIKPAPTLEEQFEARYFSIQCDVSARKIEDVKTAVPELRKWVQDVLNQSPNVKANPQIGGIYLATVSMLEYRLSDLQARNATDAADKAKAQQAGADILQQIIKDVPQLQRLIQEQLLNTLPEPIEYAKLGSLTLHALVVRAAGVLAQDEPSDEGKKLLQQGIDAAAALISRAEATTKPADITPEMLDDAALQPGYFNEKLGNKLAAARAFAAYAASAPKGDRGKGVAFDALRMLIELRRDAKLSDAEREEVQAIWGKSLVGLVRKYEVAQLYFDRARHNQNIGQLADAIADFKAVPANDSRLPYARFQQSLAISKLVNSDSSLSPAAKEAMKRDTEAALREAVSLADAALGKNPDDRTRSALQGLKVKARLQEVNLLLNDRGDARAALGMLNGMEGQTDGLADKALLDDAIAQLRLSANMKAGDLKAATDQLVKIGQTNPTRAAAVLNELFDEVRKELREAQNAGDKAREERLVSAMGQLSGLMLNRATEQKAPDLYKYFKLDADSKLRAADMEPDAAKRSAMLQTTRKNYEWMLSVDGQKQYKAAYQKDPPRSGDPGARYGLALTEYQLGNYAEAKSLLVNLVATGQLGGPLNTKPDGEQEENVPYWEGVFKMLDSSVKLNQKAEVQGFLERLYVQLGRAVGGRAWGEAFETLRKANFPELDPDKLQFRIGAPATAPAAAPAAGD